MAKLIERGSGQPPISARKELEEQAVQDRGAKDGALPPGLGRRENFANQT